MSQGCCKPVWVLGPSTTDLAAWDLKTVMGRCCQLILIHYRAGRDAKRNIVRADTWSGVAQIL